MIKKFALLVLVGVLAVSGGVLYRALTDKTAESASDVSEIKADMPQEVSVDTANLKNKQVFIFVDDTTYNALTEKINRLAEDIRNDLKSEVLIQHAEYKTPIEIRNILKQSYNAGNLGGSILIGNIPTFFGGKGFYTDWFYGDLKDSCPLSSDGKFEDSYSCNTLDSLSKRDVFYGRITPPVSGEKGLTMIGAYLDKNHAYREGKISFPKKMLLYPSVSIIDYNNGKTINKNSLAQNISSSIASQSRYASQDVDVISDTDYSAQKEAYLSKLKNNRYESAIISVHGSPDGQFPSQGDGPSAITGEEIAAAKPNIFYLSLLSCSNGAFKTPNYLAGTFLFNGDTLLVTAYSQVAFVGGFLQDPPIEPTFFQPLSFLNSNAILGDLFIHDQSLYITQIFGDPTLHLTNDFSKGFSQLLVEPDTANFGNVSSSTVATKVVVVRNIGNTTSSVLILPSWGITMNEKHLSDFISEKDQVHVMKGRDFFGFISDKSNNGSFKTLLIPPGSGTSFSFSFSPAEFAKSKQLISGTYKDIFLLLTSDWQTPYIEIPLRADQQ